VKTLVTGGAGFIGSHLVRRLLREGYEVTVVDDMSAGKYENLDLSRVELKPLSIISSNPTIRKLIEDCDVVYHLAVKCLPESLENPFTSFQVNDYGTFEVAKACTETKKKLVYVSTCEVYGETGKIPIPEDCNLNPGTPYAASKAAGEMWVKAFHHAFGLDYIIIRPFNAYGVNVRVDKYAPVSIKFIQRIRENKPPIIYGNGEQTRDFIHVEDIARGIHLATEKEIWGETVNLGTGRETSINKIAEIILKEYDSELEPVHVEERPGDVRRFCADTAKAEAKIGFKAEKNVEKSLSEVVEWYESLYQDPSTRKKN